MGRGKKKENVKTLSHLSFVSEGRGDTLTCITELHYMTAHTGPWERTLPQTPGKNGALRILAKMKAQRGREKLG